MIKLPIGTKVEVFEREGFESVSGVITGYDEKFVLVKWKDCAGSGVLKIPNPKVSINLTTKGNSLMRYETSGEAKRLAGIDCALMRYETYGEATDKA